MGDCECGGEGSQRGVRGESEGSQRGVRACVDAECTAQHASCIYVCINIYTLTYICECVCEIYVYGL